MSYIVPIDVTEACLLLFRHIRKVEQEILQEDLREGKVPDTRPQSGRRP
jgi:hypothetical protein